MSGFRPLVTADNGLNDDIVGDVQCGAKFIVGNTRQGNCLAVD